MKKLVKNKIFEIPLKLIYDSVVLLIFTSCKSRSPQELNESGPNIIFLLTDHPRWNALCANSNDIIQTLNLDFLANQEINLKNAYFTSSVGILSHSSMLSLQYMLGQGIIDVDISFFEEGLDKTYLVILRNVVYFTGHISKFAIGDLKEQPQNEFDFCNRILLHRTNYEILDSNVDSIHYTEHDYEKLFDLKTNPSEIRIVANDPAYSQMLN